MAEKRMKIVNITPLMERAGDKDISILDEFFSYPGEKFIFNPSPSIVFFGNTPLHQGTLYALDQEDIEFIKSNPLIRKLILDKKLVLLKDTELDEATLKEMVRNNLHVLDKIESGEYDEFAGKPVNLEMVGTVPSEDSILLEELKKETAETLDEEAVTKLRKRLRRGGSKDGGAGII